VDESSFSNFLANIEKIDQDPLMRESDRGCVLSRSADLENKLQTLLSNWFSETGDVNKQQTKRLFDFTGPVGNFSAKNLLSRSVGLISNELYRDLEELRNLRNLAAHASEEFSLSSEEARASLARMHYEHRKISTIQRYSPYSDKGPNTPVREKSPNETVMKGRGYVRFDKTNFIITAKVLEYEITKASLLAMTLARMVKEAQVRLRSVLSEKASAPADK
jgi:DNA-binding MltR family transcriptional regulator